MPADFEPSHSPEPEDCKVEIIEEDEGLPAYAIVNGMTVVLGVHAAALLAGHYPQAREAIEQATGLSERLIVADEQTED